MIDYSPLWETLKKKNISTYRLLKDYNFSKGTLDSLKQNRNVTLNTIDNLCGILKVPIEDIVRITYTLSDEVRPSHRDMHYGMPCGDTLSDEVRPSQRDADKNKE